MKPIKDVDELKRGMQIMYIPMHCNGDLNHKDIEYGFVTSTGLREVVFCRYWNKFYNPGESLRTIANSEATPLDMMLIHDSVPQCLVNIMLIQYCGGLEV